MKKTASVSFECPYCRNDIELDVHVEFSNKPKVFVHEENVLSYEQLHKYFPTYMNSIKSVKELRKKGVVIGQKEFFIYLREKGYLSDEDMAYNYPSLESSSKGWIVVTWSSRGFPVNKRRIFTPHFAPGFIDLIGKDLAAKVSR